jgi:hypothetical protein
LYFVRLTPDAGRYGCGVARSRDRFSPHGLSRLHAKVDANGALTLPHGVARYYPDLQQIALRPQYHLFSMSFRTAWPLKGMIHLKPHDQIVEALCIKRIPWSSAIVTMVWFLLVALGTTGFAVTYGVQGGFTSLGGVLMGIGILAIGFLVFTFGLVTVIFSYRLENSRLGKVYEELRAVVNGTAAV